MFKHVVKYTDYNGVEQEEEFCFNLTKAELMEMEMGTKGGMLEVIKSIINTRDVPKIMEIFKSILLKSYGEKTADGKRFVKIDENGRPLSEQFAQTEAYSEMFMQLASDDVFAAKFISGIIPSDMRTEVESKIGNAGNMTPQEMISKLNN